MQDNESKEWKLLEKVAMASVLEQRRARRWGLFFKLLTFAYLIFIALMLIPKAQEGLQIGEKHTAVVKVKGLIMDEESASAATVIAGLRKAFEAENSKAVVLAINSPGGSPVQAGYIYDEIMRLKAKHKDKKVYAVISDLGASAAYYIASAADEIYADKASLVGSIGVISASFGFAGLIDKLGVERRVIASGDNKDFMDPYRPLKDDEKAFWQASLDTIHQQFIVQVKKGRGARLKENDKLFSGLIWPGETALKMGLIDGLGSVSYVAREVVKAEKLVDYSVQEDPVSTLLKRVGVGMQSEIANWLMANNTPRLY